LADSYLQFSELIWNLNNDEERWCNEYLKKLESLAGEEDEEMDALYGDVEYAPDFRWEVRDDEGRYLWIYSDDYGNIEHVEKFVQAFLRRWRPDDCWMMSWSASCSKPRIGEFGGGALFITKDHAHYINAGEWAFEQEKKWKAKKLSA